MSSGICTSHSRHLRAGSGDTPPTPGSIRGNQVSDTEPEEDVQTVHIRFHTLDGDMCGEETYTLNIKEPGCDSTLGNVLAKARQLSKHPCAEVIIMGTNFVCSKRPYLKIRDVLDDAEIVPHPDRKGDMSTTYAYNLCAQVILPAGRHI